MKYALAHFKKTYIIKVSEAIALDREGE